MQLSTQHQQLIDFFAGRNLPSGPQHVNPYSVFLNLSGAVQTRLADLYCDVETTQQSAALMLREVKDWLLSQEQIVG